VNPAASNNYAIRVASENGTPCDLILLRLVGHLEVVKLLLKDPRVDPQAQFNYALHYASRNGKETV
jgi:hypothetical protein